MPPPMWRKQNGRPVQAVENELVAAVEVDVAIEEYDLLSAPEQVQRKGRFQRPAQRVGLGGMTQRGRPHQWFVPQIGQAVELQEWRLSAQHAPGALKSNVLSPSTTSTASCRVPWR